MKDHADELLDELAIKMQDAHKAIARRERERVYRECLAWARDVASKAETLEEADVFQVVIERFRRLLMEHLNLP